MTDLYYSLLAVLGLHCYMGFSLVATNGGYSLGAVLRLRTAVASLVVERRLHSCGSQALEHTFSIEVHGLSCSAARGIFLDQGSNLCLLHWQVNSLPPSHWEAPGLVLTGKYLLSVWMNEGMDIRSRQFVRAQRTTAEFGEMGANREAPKASCTNALRDALRYFEALIGQDRSLGVRSLTCLLTAYPGAGVTHEAFPGGCSLQGLLHLPPPRGSP